MYQSKHNCNSNMFLLFRFFDIQHTCFGSDSSFSYSFMPAHTHYPYSGYGRNLSYFSVTGSRQKRPGPDWFQNRSDTDRLEWCKEFSNLTQQYSQPFVLHFFICVNWMWLVNQYEFGPYLIAYWSQWRFFLIMSSSRTHWDELLKKLFMTYCTMLGREGFWAVKKNSECLTIKNRIKCCYLGSKTMLDLWSHYLVSFFLASFLLAGRNTKY